MITNELNFSLSIDEANVILNALGERPYVQVADLIVKMQLQAQEQLTAKENRSGESESLFD
jgi:hypothetical protein